MKYPQLPPVFNLKPLAPGQDPFEAAVAAARAGNGEAGDFHWSQRLDRIELAVVLEPDTPPADSLTMLPLAMVAFGDALGAVAPPVVAVHFRWPDCVDVNGGFVGGFRTAMADRSNGEDVPDWLVIGFGIAVQMDLTDDAPGRTVHQTTLYDEGCGEVTVDDLTESFARHFLTWINRWQDEGFEPVRLAWLARLKQPEGTSGALKLKIDSLGGLQCEGSATRDLSDVLNGPSWIAS
ncbi:biotin/lipoate--protein ligase family protein [Pelagibius sp. Alg239-R121]|uniref:biotin/lipoate--protein ligase family protein n=1 Tax=Pelagibius sp. Alg239-R121 TaxID=2993448 RepID=UPI0024A773CB|nr:biotin/lipoate--protein ligase family protein [Pelagibius sp. Alg239-R121]